MSIISRTHTSDLPARIVCCECGGKATRLEVTMTPIRADCPAQVWTESSVYYCDAHRGTT